MEYLYHNYGVQYFFLDHITALAAAIDGDERKALDKLMESMGSFVKKIPICITFISHLATPDGRPHEEGGRVTIRHFRGSRAIGYWAHFMFGLERNQQAETAEERSLTTFRVLKDRYTGKSVGHTFFFTYNFETGRLSECQQSAESFGFESQASAEETQI
jgi:twinkle protein